MLQDLTSFKLIIKTVTAMISNIYISRYYMQTGLVKNK
jgi:hypothetical protein